MLCLAKISSCNAKNGCHNVKRQLRPMLRSDLDTVLVVERAAYPIPWTRTNFEDCIRAKNDCCVFYSDTCVLGHSVVSYVLDEAHLLNICIDPKYSGRGHGRYYLRQLIERANQHKARMFFLEVRASNYAAIALYHSEGFNEVGVRKGYYPAQNGREDAILMTMDLRCDVFI